MVNASAIDWILILGYLKVILSGPVIFGIGALYIIKTFSNEFKALINRIDSAEFPGGKITAQHEKLKQEVSVEPVQPDPEIQLKKITLNESQILEVRQLLDAEKAIARIWEYRYLNYFLVPRTQVILDWLISFNKPTPYSIYDTIFTSIIASAQERAAIIEALEKHHLVTCQSAPNAMIEVTPKGNEYAKWPERRFVKPSEQ